MTAPDKEYLGRPPKEFVISVTLGADRTVTMRRRDKDGNPINWDAEVWMDVEVAKDEPAVRVTAEVTNDLAVVRLESEAVCDKVTNRSRWRAIMSQDQDPLPSRETPIAVGRFERHDG